MYFTEFITDKLAQFTRTEKDLHGYQLQAKQFLINNPFSALFIDCGMGKTAISLSAIMDLIGAFETNHVLIIAPVRVANETWPTEIAQWEHTAPLSYSHIRNELLVETVNKAGDDTRKILMNEAKAEAKSKGLVKNDLAQYVKEIRSSKATKMIVEAARLTAAKTAVREFHKKANASVFIINREQVEFLVEAWGRDWPYDTVIIDESSAFKDHTTNRFKALKLVRKLIKRMHQLTATPVAESYVHLFAQLYLLDMGERLGKNITSYKLNYFNQCRYTMRYTLREGAEAQITQKISDICLVMKAEDYLQQEYPTFVFDQVILSPSEQAIYDSMQTSYVAEMVDGTIVEAETAAAKSQKLQQIASGVLYQTVLTLDEYGEMKSDRIVHEIHNHKIDKLQQIIDSTESEPLLVAYIMQSSLARLKLAFPHAVVMDKQGKCVTAWNSGKIKLLLFSPMSAAHGLNLQYGGRRLVFFDIPYSFELYYQAYKRLARQGQKLSVFVHHIVAKGSIDYDIAQCLSDKDATQEKFFELLKKLRKKLI